MALTVGARLGAYEIVALIGAGGMGEVYRARDTRLNRDVALKILPESFAADPDRLARFEQEARAAAALNHPNILAVHDIGRHDGIPFIVSELLEGETLRERLQAGTLPVRKAVEYAIEIAKGLAAAHHKGIVHRDLKPENIFIASDDRVKILDFGLAKLTQTEVAAVAVSALPTTPPTQAGVVLGTVGYMAPEQVRGEPADHRADIFAFGAVLYEMLSGRHTFRRETAVETMAAILREEPPELSTLERNIPAALDRIVHRCLAKNPVSRFGTAGDLAFTLEELSLFDRTAADARGAAGGPRSARIRPLAAALVVLSVVAGVAFLGSAALAPGTVSSEDSPAYRLSLLPPPGTTIPVPGLPPDRHFALSPDGRRLAFIAMGPDGVRMLWVRSLDGLEVQPLAGTEAAQAPFWSPDSQWIGFFTSTELKKIAVRGGAPLTLCTCASNGSGSWNSDDVILFSDGQVLHRIGAAGGTAAVVRRPDPDSGEVGYLWPWFLPDGQRFLYRVNEKTNQRVVYVGSLDSNERTRLLGNSNAAYAAEHVIFMQGPTLVAQPLDLANLQLTGQPIPLAEQVLTGPQGPGTGAFTVSQTGVLAYHTVSAAGLSRLVWQDRSGRQLGTVSDESAGVLFDIELSPDGGRAAVSIARGSPRDVWIYDLSRRLPTRFTFDAANDFASVWSPDGSRIVFESNRTGTFDLFQKSAGGTGSEVPLLQAEGGQRIYDWSPDGRFILYGATAAQNPLGTAVDVWVLPLSGDRKPFPLLQSEFREHHGRFSPDGRWVAYVSNESGRDEVYVTRFPNADRKWQVSATGGSWPRWRHDGREIFYIAPDGHLTAVSVNGSGGAVQVGPAQRLFVVRTGVAGTLGYQYDVAADGERFLVNALTDEVVPEPLTVLVNWPALLEQ